MESPEVKKSDYKAITSLYDLLKERRFLDLFNIIVLNKPLIFIKRSRPATYSQTVTDDDILNWFDDCPDFSVIIAETSIETLTVQYSARWIVSRKGGESPKTLKSGAKCFGLKKYFTERKGL